MAFSPLGFAGVPYLLLPFVPSVAKEYPSTFSTTSCERVPPLTFSTTVVKQYPLLPFVPSVVKE